MERSTFSLDDQARSMYRLVAVNPRAALDDLAARLRISPGEAQGCLDQLVASCLVRPAADGSFVVVNPEIAANRLLGRQEEALLRRQQELLAQRAEITQLVSDYLDARRLKSMQARIEVVHGLENIRATLEDLAELSVKCVHTMAPGGGQREETLEAALKLDLAALRRGVQIRTLFQHPARTHHATKRYAAEISRAGAQVRTTGEMPTRMVIYDHTVAVVPLNRKSTGDGVILVRDQVLVDVFTALFDSSWQHAADYGAEELRDADTPNDLGLAIVQLLAAGKKDEVVARQVGLSVRSTRRIIAELMAQLGAESRFEAGVRAALRGWIPSPLS